MLLFIGGFLLGALTNRWWFMVLPAAVGIVLGSSVNLASAVLSSAVGAFGTVLGVSARRFLERRSQTRSSPG
jgi:hypothetical protein